MNTGIAYNIHMRTSFQMLDKNAEAYFESYVRTYWNPTIRVRHIARGLQEFKVERVLRCRVFSSLVARGVDDGRLAGILKY